MEQEVTPTRRSVVTVGAAAALGVAGVGTLAACGGGSSASTATSAAAGAASAAGAATSAAGAATSAAAGAANALAKLADVPVGGALVSGDLILVQATAGQVTAFANKCTHQGCALAVNGASLDCPCHGSKFDLTGKATQGPATQALAAAKVKVDGESIVSA